MREFNKDKFCSDLISLRGKTSQKNFAFKLGLKRPTLSLIENGRQIPTLDILSKVCDMSGKSVDDYFCEPLKDGLVCFIESLDSNDKSKIETMIKHLKILEKYESLAKRGTYENSRD